MPKQRRTRKDKLMTTQRRQESQGFVVKEEWLKAKKVKATVSASPAEAKYFKTDLTKTLLLTMLVLALELAIWNYLSRH